MRHAVQRSQPRAVAALILRLIHAVAQDQNPAAKHLSHE